MLSILQSLAAWIPVGLPAFVFVVTTVVFFHELGHFSVARAFGIKVDTFSIGFGPAIFGWTDRKGTRWKISWIPLGGYVKFFGDLDAASVPDREHVKNLSADQKLYAFPLRPVYQRAAVVLAGPLANFVLAIVILTLMFMTVGARGLSSYIGDVLPHSPAAIGGIKAGDQVVAIDGKSIDRFTELQQIVSGSKGKPLTFRIKRAGRPLRFTLTPAKIEGKTIFGDSQPIMGIGVAPITDRNFVYVRLGLPDAILAAAGETWAIVDLSLTYAGRIVTGRSDTSQLAGPIGMANITKTQASRGPYDLFWLIALISVSIGLVNLFPIPVLDGGHLLYYGCEAVLGRPLGERAQDVGFRLGFAVVLALMLLATWNDLIRLNL